MTIYYSPEFSGNVFLGIKDRGVLFDTDVVDTMGLVGLIELRLGLRFDGADAADREAAYYRAVTQYMTGHPGNVLSRSFELSGLEVARACLRWRDTLSLLGWSPESPAVSSRLAVLAGIEESFRCPGFPERVKAATEALRQRREAFRGDTILLPCDIELLHPAVRAIIGIMVDGGSTLGTLPEAAAGDDNLSRVRAMLQSPSREPLRLDPRDRSFTVLHFPTELDALTYMAYQKDDAYYVWINADNKAMDNWLKMMGKPTAGSTMGSCVPQTAQLLSLGVGLFYRPLNVNTLVQWLYSPVHPLEARFRYSLAELVASEGGLDNEACRKAIDDYIEGCEDKERAKARVSVFLPDSEGPDDGHIGREELIHFTSELKDWATDYIHAIEGQEGSALRAEQLGALAGFSASFLTLLESVSEERLPYDLVESWISALYAPGTFTQYRAQAGSRFVVDSPAKLAGISSGTVWCGFYDAPEFRSSVDFLSPDEIEALHLGGCPARENALAQSMQMLAFTHTDGSIAFVTVDRRHGQPVDKHPLMIRFEKQIENLRDFIEHPAFDDSAKVRVEGVQNATHDIEYVLSRPELIRWPNHISHTSMDLLVQHPLDYVMQNIAGIQGSSVPAMADVKRTSGIVAHAVIEALFSPEEGQLRDAAEVKAMADGTYPEVFEAQVDAHGAILNLRENLLDKKQLKEELRQCVYNLIEILSDNGLRVKWCEKGLHRHIGLLDGDDDPWVNGFVDMTLEDASGDPVVFDFKWTSSKKYYQGLLQENISSQLALYRHLLQLETGREVKRTAYFLMPEGRLYSRETFLGFNCERVSSDDDSDLVAMMKASYAYRREQILSGHVENSDGLALGQTAYGSDQEEKGLFPLHQEDDGSVTGNRFSDYPLFK